jgi:tetratricopeptide (TPR) repeat protein
MEAAVDYYEAAMTIGQDLGLEDLQTVSFLGHAYRETGLAYEGIGEFETSLTFLNKALGIYKDIESLDIPFLLDELDRVKIFLGD